MKHNISLPAELACSGCGACGAVCPKGAIRLELNRAGFNEAVVEESLCIGCGLCQKVCARFADSLTGAVSLYEAKLYAMQSRDPETVRTSTSGGIARELTAWALDRGWKVIGAVYNPETNRAEHRTGQTPEQTAAFAGSKYLQSNPMEAFRNALEEARRDPEAKFLVTGTPCQMVGMAKAAQQLGLRDRFLLVEIFCHGVPSYHLWDLECDKIRKKLNTDTFDRVQFRYKKDDWHSYCLKVDAGEKTFYGSRETTFFYQVFFENILLGDSCWQCRARKEQSQADIRLGDYWGRKFQHRSDGVSAAFACTARGKAALEALVEAKQVVCLDATTAEEMLRAQNMAGYSQRQLHQEAMAVLRSGGDIRRAVALYRRKLPARQKLKRHLLGLSGLIPTGLRTKLRKAHSLRQLK